MFKNCFRDNFHYFKSRLRSELLCLVQVFSALLWSAPVWLVHAFSALLRSTVVPVLFHSLFSFTSRSFLHCLAPLYYTCLFLHCSAQLFLVWSALLCFTHRPNLFLSVLFCSVLFCSSLLCTVQPPSCCLHSSLICFVLFICFSLLC